VLLVFLGFCVVFFVLFVFVLCLVNPVLSVSLDCLRPVSCEPSVVSVSGLSSSCVLWTQCCQCLWIVFALCLVNPVLSVSLDCPFLIAPSVFSNVYLVRITRVIIYDHIRVESQILQKTLGASKPKGLNKKAKIVQGYLTSAGDWH
jgi:hypothetical protein